MNDVIFCVRFEIMGGWGFLISGGYRFFRENTEKVLRFTCYVLSEKRYVSFSYVGVIFQNDS
jgi:hypothetical protein